LFERLDEAFPEPAKSHSPKIWRIYCDGTPQVIAFRKLWEGDRIKNWYRTSDFFDHLGGSEQLPKYSFIEPRHTGALSNSQHPSNNKKATSGSSDFERGEDLIRRIYEALCAKPEVFEKTMLVITYDEHGGLFDHEPPPRAKHPTPLRYGGRPVELVRRLVAFFVEHRRSPFDFRCYGVRVPAVVVSPWIDAGCVDDTLYDHTSVIATAKRLFDVKKLPLTRRDRNANSLHRLVEKRDAPRTSYPPLPPRPRVVAPAEDAAVSTPGSADRQVPPGAKTGRLAETGDSLEEQLKTLDIRAIPELHEIGVHKLRQGLREEPGDADLSAGDRLLAIAAALREQDERKA
jgi:Phosphoesterase family